MLAKSIFHFWDPVSWNLVSIIGLVLLLADKFPGLYKNPLDFSFKKGNFSFYFPLGTSILLSVILTLFFYFFKKWIKVQVFQKINFIGLVYLEYGIMNYPKFYS